MYGFDEKIWGYTREVENFGTYSRHELILNANHYCSLHYHIDRSNKFIITSGSVVIFEFYGPSVKRIDLHIGDDYIVPSLVPHLFAVVESGSMVEEYYANKDKVVLSSDIVRLCCGGRYDDLEQLPYNLMLDILKNSGYIKL